MKDNPYKIQQLVLFKDKEDYLEKVKKEKDYKFGTDEQEDKIQIKYELRPVGRYYRYSVMIINSSKASINEGKIKIMLPIFMELYRHTPPTLETEIIEKEEIEVKIKLDQIEGNSSKQINLYLIPLMVDKTGEIRSILTFINNKDLVRVINANPIEIYIPELVIEGLIIPSSKIPEIYQDKDFKKTMISIGAPTKRAKDLNDYLEKMETKLKHLKFQYITRDIKNNVIWYYGKCWNKARIETTHQHDVLLIGQIISGKIEFLLMCKNQDYLVSLSTLIFREFSFLIMREGTPTSNKLILILECKSCGVVLPYLPKKGEEITCNKCQYKQIIW